MAGRKKTGSADTTEKITKGMAKGTPPPVPENVGKCKELYEVLNVRGIKGVQLRTAQECLDYVSEY